MMDDVAQSIARERLEQDRKRAIPRETLVKRALELGTDPAYVAMRYGVDLQRCISYKQRFEQQKEKAKG